MSFHCFLTFCCVPKHVGMNKGFLFTPCSILIAISQVLIEIHNGEHVWHILFAFWVIRALKCEAVNFIKFESAGIPVRPIKCLDMPILITWFTYDANHITMTSPAFAFHSCQIGRRWHDIISVCIVGTPHHHGLHHMGMT